MQADDELLRVVILDVAHKVVVELIWDHTKDLPHLGDLNIIGTIADSLIHQ